MKAGIARRRRRRRWLIAAGVTAIAAGVVANRAALGGRATGARLQRMRKSPEWQRSHFENPQPIEIRQNIANIGVFVMKQTVDMQMNPDPAKLKSLIDINCNLAAGLSGRG